MVGVVVRVARRRHHRVAGVIDDRCRHGPRRVARAPRELPEHHLVENDCPAICQVVPRVRAQVVDGALLAHAAERVRDAPLVDLDRVLLVGQSLFEAGDGVVPFDSVLAHLVEQVVLDQIAGRVLQLREALNACGRSCSDQRSKEGARDRLAHRCA